TLTSSGNPSSPIGTLLLPAGRLFGSGPAARHLGQGPARCRRARQAVKITTPQDVYPNSNSFSSPFVFLAMYPTVRFPTYEFGPAINVRTKLQFAFTGN